MQAQELILYTLVACLVFSDSVTSTETKDMAEEPIHRPTVSLGITVLARHAHVTTNMAQTSANQSPPSAQTCLLSLLVQGRK